MREAIEEEGDSVAHTIEDAFVKTLMTTLDICNHDFRRKRNGYDPQEVDEFLMRVAKDFEAIRQKYFAVKSELERLLAKPKADELQPAIETTVDKEGTTYEPASGDHKVLTQLKEALSMFETKQDLEQEVAKLRNELEQLQDQIAARHAYLSSLNELIDRARDQLRRLVENATDLLEVVSDDGSA